MSASAVPAAIRPRSSGSLAWRSALRSGNVNVAPPRWPKGWGELYRVGAPRLIGGEPIRQGVRPLGRGAGAQTDDHITCPHMTAQQRSKIAHAVDGHDRRVPSGADALRHVMLIDALDRLLAGRIERCHDDAVGIAEAGAEIAEEIMDARVAVRLKHGDDSAAGTGTSR